MVALRELERIEQSLSDEGDDKATWYVEKARAHLRAGDYDEAEAHAELALTRLGASLLGEVAAGNRPDEGGDGAIALVAEALATSGIAQSLSARHEEAADTLQRSVEVARGAGEPRVLAVALGSWLLRCNAMIASTRPRTPTNKRSSWPRERGMLDM